MLNRHYYDPTHIYPHCGKVYAFIYVYMNNQIIYAVLETALEEQLVLSSCPICIIVKKRKLITNKEESLLPIKHPSQLNVSIEGIAFNTKLWNIIQGCHVFTGFKFVSFSKMPHTSTLNQSHYLHLKQLVDLWTNLPPHSPSSLYLLSFLLCAHAQMII